MLDTLQTKVPDVVLSEPVEMVVLKMTDLWHIIIMLFDHLYNTKEKAVIDGCKRHIW